MKTEFPGLNPMKSNNFIIQIILQIFLVVTSFLFSYVILFFYNLGTSLWGLDGKFHALTVSFLIVHFLFFFSSANTIFNAFFLFLWISGFFFTCVSALQILAKFSSLDSKCVVKVFCLTLVLLCFLGMAIKSANFTFLATSFSVKMHIF